MADPRLLTTCERIIRLRLVRGFTSRAQLALLLGVNEDTLGTYENGRTLPPPHTAVRLSELLDCTLDYLYKGSTTGMPIDTLMAVAAVTEGQIAAARRTGPKRGRKS